MEADNGQNGSHIREQISEEVYNGTNEDNESEQDTDQRKQNSQEEFVNNNGANEVNEAEQDTDQSRNSDRKNQQTQINGNNQSYGQRYPRRSARNRRPPDRYALTLTH